MSPNWTNESRSGVGTLEPWNLVETVLIVSVLLMLILCMLIGNLFVILAILLERDLKRPQYYLILSLAVADLMVGVVVSPIATVYSVHREWTMGATLCDFYISIDVLVCSSSILHLVAIALDRYWSITDILYMQRRTPTRIGIMLAIVWGFSALISVAPIFGWKDNQFAYRIEHEKVCVISQELSYQVFATATAFYIPLLCIIGIYYKIFKAAKSRFRRERDRKSSASKSRGSLVTTTNPTATRTTTLATPSGVSQKLLAPNRAIEELQTINDDGASGYSTDTAEDLSQCNGTPASGKIGSQNLTVNPEPKTKYKVLPRIRRKGQKESADARRERKAWRTVAIITGTFVASWLPFFILALVRPICNCQIDPILEWAITWLGYVNSAVNPVIYTIFSPDFRLAFQRILKRLCFWH